MSWKANAVNKLSFNRYSRNQESFYISHRLGQMLKKDGRDRKQNTRLSYCQVFCTHSCPCIFVDTFLGKVFFSICSGKDSKPLILITSISMPQITPSPKEYKICYILGLDKETQPWKKSSTLPAFYHQYALSSIDRVHLRFSVGYIKAFLWVFASNHFLSNTHYQMLPDYIS